MSSTTKNDGELEDRLDELDEKQRSYEKLQTTLTNLPRCLSHKSFVPLGPRLYTHGNLVRTNEVLVMLGSDGENSFFAERSAYQAGEIVQRRLEAVEKARSQAITEQTEKKMSRLNESCIENSNQKILATNSNKDDTTLKNRFSSDSCSQKAPVVSKCGDANALKTKPSSETGGQKVLERSNRLDNIVWEKEKEDDTKMSVPRRRPSILRHHNSDTGSEGSSSLRHVRFQEDMTEELSKKSDKTANPVGSDASAGADADDDDDDDDDDGKRDLQTVLKNAILSAQHHAKDDGIVQFTEFYADDNDNEPTSVDMSKSFRSDGTVSFEDESEEFLDMSGVRKEGADTSMKSEIKKGDIASSIDAGVGKESEPRTDEDERDMIVQDLLEAEKAFEEEEGQGAGQEQTKESEFGSGFARGFLGGKRSSKEKKNEKAVSKASEVEADNDEKGLGNVPVHETVVERKPAAIRRRRKTPIRRRDVQRDVINSLAIEEEREEEDLEGMMTGGVMQDGGDDEEDYDAVEGKQVSKFKQMRERQRRQI